MTDPQRYGLYFTPPPESPLAQAGAAWLGRSIETGFSTASLCDCARTPARYGFHATLKPPFRLADGTTPAGLLTAVRDLAARHKPVTIPQITLAALGRFLALVPAAPLPALGALAAACVTDLDPFRAPMTPEEAARRRARPLSPAQERNLTDWGYPHVMDLFRFHMTLTDRLPGADLPEMQRRAEAHFAALLGQPLTIDAVTLVGEDAGGRFHTLERIPLTGPAA